MKFVMDERVKHRITGVVVILAIMIVFLPAILKKSNRHFEDNMNLSVRLPAKPLPPMVKAPSKTQLFQSVKVAKVTIPSALPLEHSAVIAEATPLHIESSLPVIPLLKRETDYTKTEAKKAVVTAVSKPVMSRSFTTTKKGPYGVQLASFTQQSNAESLVAKLRHKGYVATYNKYNGKNGEFYKVVVGALQKNEAEVLQKKLAANMQLNGFIVKTGVS